MTTLDLLSTPRAAALSVANNGAVSRETAPSAVVAVPLAQVADNPYQPRGAYDPEHILKLALSIKRLKRNLPATMGLQQVPLARLAFLRGDGGVEMAGRDWYEGGRAQQTLHEKPAALAQLMFGHSRLRALMLLNDGLRYALRHNHMGIQFGTVPEVETVYADLLEGDRDYAVMPLVLGFALDHDMWTHAITENSQRKNINAIEEAQSIQRAMDEFGLSPEEAGKPFGYARSTTANKVRLLALPAEVQRMIAVGELSERHGRELLRVAADPERVKRLAEGAATKGTPVRQLAESVNWEEKALKAAAEKARELAAARAALAVGWRLTDDTAPIHPSVVDLEDWKFSEFNGQDAGHVALLQHGKCSPEHCACLVVGYSQHRGTNGFRPDPDNAPHCCLACTDSRARYAKELALGDEERARASAAAKRKRQAEGMSDEERARASAAAERKRQAALINNAAHTAWQRWLKEQDRHALWNSISFWRAVFGTGLWGVEKIVKSAPDVQTACTELLELLYQNTRSYDNELGNHVHTVAEVKKLIGLLSDVSRSKADEYANIEQVWEATEDDRSEGADDDEQDED